MELCTQTRPDGLAVFLDLGIGHVLLDVGHHILGAIASVGGAQTFWYEKGGVISWAGSRKQQCIIETAFDDERVGLVGKVMEGGLLQGEWIWNSGFRMNDWTMMKRGWWRYVFHVLQWYLQVLGRLVDWTILVRKGNQASIPAFIEVYETSYCRFFCDVL